MYADEFHLLLSGLSGESRFAEAWGKAPKHVHDPAERASITASLLR